MTIKKKLYLITIISLIIFGIFMIFLITNNFKSNFIKQRKNYGRAILESFISNLEFGVSIANRNYLKKICNKIVKISFIAGIEIYKNNKLLIKEKKNTEKVLTVSIIKKEIKSYQKVLPLNKPYKIAFVKPKSATKIKYVLLVSLDDMDTFFNRYRVKVAILIIMLFSIMFFFIGYFINKFLTPLSLLSESFNEMKELNFKKIEGNFPKELQPLITVFNESVMEIASKSSELNGKISELKRVNRELNNKIKEIKALQKIVINNEKLASIGTMAAGIAHEINNPLAGIQGLTELLLYSDNTNIDKKKLEKIIENCKRISEIVRQLKGYSSNEKKRSKYFLKDVIEDSVDILKQSKKFNDITLKGSFLSSNTVFYCKKNDLIQVFTNLFDNSVHASRGKCEISIDITEHKENIEITYSDSGPGIPKEIKEKIFEPFFTTKQEKGTGLGMYICFKILSEYNGSIEVIDKTNGACFKILLPKKDNGEDNEKNRTHS